jgi:hypothetical protein
VPLTEEEFEKLYKELYEYVALKNKDEVFNIVKKYVAFGPVTVETVSNKIPEDLRKMLTFEDKGEYIKITKVRYLDKKNFAEIARIVRDVGGEYVSAGKDSHFRVPKVKP